MPNDRQSNDMVRGDGQNGRPPGREPGDKNRERMAWALFFLLAIYVLAHPFMPAYSPDPGIAGTLAGTVVTLLTVRILRAGGIV